MDKYEIQGRMMKLPLNVIKLTKRFPVSRESDETVFWLELIIASGLVPEEQVAPILKEANEIVAMMVRSLITAKESLKKLNKNPNKSEIN
ncbi:MAG: hypothetical protein PHW35_03060 [Lentimicrobiaceae bacterium]|jgi:hypothetical protein|nr:hypothetical protein [Lentimicrobiaceae bacterium]MDD4596924.1 hypothetical protein [Lentimicrobiaceae bacterium]MDY0025790.1 hypothetical protein [Lentimicrobium sp.]HAH59590.1 hypothetical protein [Bacteroidales bacterium]